MTDSRWAHQEREWAHRRDMARAFLWQQRTGKTRMAVEHAVALHDCLEISGVLVIAPNGVHAQWADEQVARWGGGVIHHAFAWRLSDPQNGRAFEVFMENVRVGCCGDYGPPGGLFWLCVNMESIIRDDTARAITRFKKTVGRAMLVVDESHHFARAGARRTAAARALGRQFEYRRILTGTLSENSHRQVFTQFEILERGALGHQTLGSFDREFTEFEERRFAGRVVRVPVGGRNLGVLKQRMARLASVVTRDQCEDLPPVQFDARTTEMTPTQRRYWDAVREKLLLECEALGHDRVYSGGAALVKLQQIEGGFCKMPDGTVDVVVRPEHNPKMLILLDEIIQYDGKVIVWHEYVHEIEVNAEMFREAGIIQGRYHGQMNQGARDETLRQFRAGEIKVLLAQPRAGGEGRDMSAAGKILWYSETPDATVRSQANERATRWGGKSAQVVDILVGPVGRYFLSLCERKTALAEDLTRSGLRAVLEGL